MDKREIRKKIKKLRDSISKEERKVESEILFKKIVELNEYENSRKILSFMNFGSEIEIEILNRKIVEDEKKLYLPRVEKDGKLSIVEYGKGFKVGSFGIKEPIGENYTGDLDMIITPGLAFDRAGNRIGYGKGYYDRLFEKYFSVLKVAPIFEIQLFEKIPNEEHDIKIDIIITKNEFLKINEVLKKLS